VLNGAMRQNVIILIISLVIGLIVCITNLWQKNDAFAIGFMRAWYGLLNFFDTIPAYFWQLAEWILSPMIWLLNNLTSVYDTVFNGIIDGINWVLGAINKVTGSSYEITAKFSAENLADSMTEFLNVKKDDAYARAAEKVAERDQKLQDFIKSRADKRAEEGAGTNVDEKTTPVSDQWNPGGNMQDINRVNEVGSINETVDISSEDLKTMRELAEMKNIQNFVSLQPTVSVQTGDINNGHDIDTIIGRIEKTLNEQIATSAEGVYA
ncbi:phage tail protein, partial [Paenibacillus sp. MCAF20]